MSSRAAQLQAAKEKKEQRKQLLQYREEKRKYREYQELRSTTAATTSADQSDASQPESGSAAVANPVSSSSSSLSSSSSQAQAQGQSSSGAATRTAKIPVEILDPSLPFAPSRMTVAATWAVLMVRRCSGILFRSIYRFLSFLFSKYFLILLAVVIAALLVLPPIGGSTARSENDPYDLLGVSRNATDAEVVKAYRKLSVKYHPDRNRDPEAAVMFMRIGRAKETLTDPQKKANYDEFGDPDGPKFMGVSFPAFLVRRDRGFVVFYILIILMVAAIPLLYWFSGGTTPRYDTRPPSILVRQVVKNAEQMGRALEEGNQEQARVRGRWVLGTYRYILQKMPEWRPSFAIHMMAIAFNLSLASLKMRAPAEAASVMTEIHGDLKQLPEYVEIKKRLRRDFDAIATAMRKEMEAFKDEKDKRSDCSQVEGVLKWLLSSSSN
eukprot:ANDGO_02665.mRNA.1 DnaJ protein ERDJ2A